MFKEYGNLKSEKCKCEEMDSRMGMTCERQKWLKSNDLSNG